MDKLYDALTAALAMVAFSLAVTSFVVLILLAIVAIILGV